MDHTHAPHARLARRRANGLAVALMFGAALAGASSAALARPGGRLDADERERLRQELREQRGYGRGPAPAYYPPASPRHERPMPPAYGPVPHPRWRDGGGSPRMSPEERHELRMQLRERHRHRD